MRISATGPACAAWGAVQAEIDRMMAETGTPVQSNAVATAGTGLATGNQLYAQLLEIPSAPDLNGNLPAMAGKVLLVPNASTYAKLRFLDPVAGTLTDGPAYTETPGVRFSCAVRLPDDRTILLVPHHAQYFWLYDVFTNAVTRGPARYKPGTVSGAVPAYGGAAVGRDGLVYLSPGHADDKRVHIYNPLTNTVDTASGPVLPYGPDWQALDHSGSVLPLPDGSILFLTRRTAALGAPWRCTFSGGAWSVTLATVTSTTTASAMATAALTNDGKEVVICDAGLINKIRKLRLSNNELYDALSFTPNVNNNPWSGLVRLPDGRLAFVGNGQRSMGIFDAAGAMNWSPGHGDFSGLGIGGADGGGANTLGGIMLSSGKVLINPGATLSRFFTWQPFTAGTVPSGVRYSRYVARR